MHTLVTQSFNEHLFLKKIVLMHAAKDVKWKEEIICKTLFLCILSFKACRKMAPSFVPFEKKKQEKLFGFHLVRLLTVHILCMGTEIGSIF